MAYKFQLNLRGGVATQYASIFIYILRYMQRCVVGFIYHRIISLPKSTKEQKSNIWLRGAY